MVLHSSRQPADGLHGIVTAATATNPNLGPYADSPTRLTAGSLLGATDIGKVVKQLDTSQYWMLIAIGVWLRVAGPRSVYTDATTARTFALTDADALGCFSNAAGAVCTVPLNATIAFPVGAELEACQLGAGQVSFSPFSGSVILRAPDGFLGTRVQYSTIKARKIATDTWLVSGDLAAVASSYTHPALAVSSATVVGAYDAEFSTLATGVSQLADQGPGTKHLAHATGSKQPVFTLSNPAINNKPSCRFDGTDDELLCASLALTSSGVYITGVVSKLSVNGSMFGGATNQACSLVSIASELSAYGGAGAFSTSTAFGSPSPALGTNWCLFELHYDTGGAGIFRVTWNNGTGDVNHTTWTAGSASDTSWGIGSRAGGNYGSLDFANLSIFASKPSAPDRTALRAALISRYALPFS